MRIVFMGTPDFALPTLDALVAARHEIVAAYTQPPRPAGRRGRELVPSPIQRRAEVLGIPVRSPARLRGAEEQAAFSALDADVAVVAAYGLILPQPVLDAPRRGCLNVHGSMLPRWRGAAPVQRAILAGDTETGVCIMRMEAGLDTGPVLLDGRVRIDGKTAGELTAELATLGAALMVETLATLDARAAVPQPDEGVTYAAKIDKAEARIDWSRPAEEIERLVRAMNPAPGAWFEMGSERVKVLEARLHPGQDPYVVIPGGGVKGGAFAIDPNKRAPALRGAPGTVFNRALVILCGDGALRPTLLQRAGGKPMTAMDFLRGFALPPGTQL